MADGGKLIIKIDGDTKGFYDKTGGLNKFANKALKGIATGAAAVGAAMVGIGTAAVKSYADYEQLVGGVDTLFKESSQKLQKYAAEAYKTAGISGNAYMQNVTSFSASLLSSLGGDTEKAADVANMALTDMSDNANKMGTSMESITNAYQGFAKQQYMLLDNLKLGYGGTKTEMERLLKDAQAISGVKYDINNLADVYEAIHVIQTEIGITGTTAKEAATTITGSFNMAKAAWENLVVGIADPNQDIDVLVDNFVSSVGTLLDNVMPRIKAVADEIADLLIKYTPEWLKVGVSAIAAFGVALVGLKLGLVVNDFHNLIKGVKDFTTATKLGASAQKIMNAEIFANPYAIAFVALSALITGVATYAATHKSAMKEIEEGYQSAIKSIDETTASEIARAETVQTLTDKLFDLEEQINSGALTDEEAADKKAQFNAVAKDLNKTIPGLINHLYDETGAINIQDVAVKNLVATYIRLARAKAYAAAYEDKMKEEAALVVEYETKRNDIKDSLKRVNDVITNNKDNQYAKTAAYMGRSNGGAGAVSKLERQLEDVDKKIAESNDRMDKWAAGYAENMAIVDESSEKVGNNVSKVASNVTNSVKKETNKQSEIIKKQQEKELSDLKFLHSTKAISDAEYYDELGKYRDKYFDEGSEEWQKFTEEIISYNQNLAEESAKAIENTFDDLVDKAEDAVKEVLDAQESLEDKLKNSVELFTEETVAMIGSDREKTIIKPGDLKSQTEELRRYGKNLENIRAISYVPKEFFQELRDMSIEEGSKFAELLLGMSDEAFEEYIKDWTENREAIEEISKILYKEEAEGAQNVVNESFKAFGESMEADGVLNASAWGKGFLEEVKAQIPEILETINSAFGSILSVPSYGLTEDTVVKNFVNFVREGPIHLDGSIVLGDREVGKVVYESYNQEKRRLGE